LGISGGPDLFRAGCELLFGLEYVRFDAARVPSIY